MLIRIEGVDLPGSTCRPGPDPPDGYHHVHVAVQRRNRPDDLLGVTPGNASSAAWTLDCVPTPTSSGFDLAGPHIQGRPGARFIYLSWGTVQSPETFTLFRRAKLWLDAVAPEVLARAVEQGVLLGRLGLTDDRGDPRCASVRPPLVAWSSTTPT